MWKGQIAMNISNFIELCESKGYPCQVNKGKLEVFRFYGEELSNHIKIATINLAAPNQFEMKLDTTSASDGIGELICEFGTSSLRERGRLDKYSYKDGNLFGLIGKLNF